MKLLIAAFAVVTLVLGTFCGYLLVAESRERAVRVGVEQQINRLAESVDKLTRVMELTLQEQRQMQPGHLYAHWYSAGSPPVLREVDTERHVGESDHDWQNRHDRDVATLRSTYPPV